MAAGESTTRPDEARGTQSDTRCPVCDYFIFEPITIEGVVFTVVLKTVCRSCRERLIVTITPQQIVVGQV